MGGIATEASSDTTSGFSSADVGSAVNSCLPPCQCNDQPAPMDPSTMCQSGCDYYVKRNADFKARHTCPECAREQPPDYYLNYGLKYCMRFTTVTAPTLSPEGQAWLVRARCNLQVTMEKGLQKDPALETDSDAFRKFAFDTHPAAYLDAGMAELSISDQYNVACAPDLKEWLSADTWHQAVQVAPPVLKADAARAAAAVGDAADSAAAKIQEWFGF